MNKMRFHNGGSGSENKSRCVSLMIAAYRGTINAFAVATYEALQQLLVINLYPQMKSFSILNRERKCSVTSYIKSPLIPVNIKIGNPI